MALNPNISLNVGQGVPQFDPIASIGGAAKLKDLMIKNQYLEQEKLSALESARLEQEQARANITGIQQQNTQRERELNTNTVKSELYRKHRYEKKDANGKPTGEFGYDMDKIREEAYADPRIDFKTLYGLDQEAAKTAQGNIKTKSELSAFIDKEAETARKRLAYAKTPQERAAIMTSVKNAADLAGNAVNDPQHVMQHLNSVFQVPTDETGKPTLTTPEAVDAHLQGLGNQWLEEQKGVITKQQEVEAGFREREVRAMERGEAASLTDPNSQNPSSPVSRDAQARVEKAMKLAPGSLKSWSLTKLSNDKTYAPALGGILLPAEARVAAGKEAGAAEVKTTKLKEGIEALNSSKVMTLGTKAGSFAAEKWQQYVSQGGVYGQLQGAIDEYNRQTGEKLAMSDGIEVVRSKLAQQARTLGTEKAEAQKRTAPTVEEAVSPSETVKLMRISDGKILTVTQEQAQRGIASGKYKKP